MKKKTGFAFMAIAASVWISNGTSVKGEALSDLFLGGEEMLAQAEQYDKKMPEKRDCEYEVQVNEDSTYTEKGKEWICNPGEYTCVPLACDKNIK